MGGIGSGRQSIFGTRSVCEDSQVLDISRLTIGPDGLSFGKLRWTNPQSQYPNASYVVHITENKATAAVIFSRPGTSDLLTGIFLESTNTQFKGMRWWFTCPLPVGNKMCGRRCSKLYLPPFGRQFGCRDCHKLTYQSVQRSQRSKALAELENEYKFEITSESEREKLVSG